MATVYWYYGGVSDTWATAGNWWDDLGHSTPHGAAPAAGDDIIVINGSGAYPSTGPASGMGTLNFVDISGENVTLYSAKYTAITASADSAGTTLNVGGYFTTCTLTSGNITVSNSSPSAVVFPGDVTISTNGDVNINSDWKINNGAAGGSITITKPSTLGNSTIGAPHAAQVKSFDTIHVECGPTGTVDVDVAAIDITGSYYIDPFAVYSGPDITLTNANATAELSGIIVVDTSLEGCIGGNIFVI